MTWYHKAWSHRNDPAHQVNYSSIFQTIRRPSDSKGRGKNYTDAWLCLDQVLQAIQCGPCVSGWSPRLPRGGRGWTWRNASLQGIPHRQQQLWAQGRRQVQHQNNHWAELTCILEDRVEDKSLLPFWNQSLSKCLRQDASGCSRISIHVLCVLWWRGLRNLCSSSLEIQILQEAIQSA